MQQKSALKMMSDQLEKVENGVQVASIRVQNAHLGAVAGPL